MMQSREGAAGGPTSVTERLLVRGNIDEAPGRIDCPLAPA